MNAKPHEFEARLEARFERANLQRAIDFIRSLLS